MKARKVIIQIEVLSAETVKELKDQMKYYFHNDEPEVRVNVIRETKPRKKKKK